MAAIINKGWAYFTDGADTMKVYFDTAVIDLIREPTFQHLEGGYNYGYDLGKTFLSIKFKNLYFGSHTLFANFIKYMNSWQASGSITTGIYRNSTSELISLKGTGNGTTFSMMMAEGLKGMEKLSRGDQQTYVIKNLRMEESG